LDQQLINHAEEIKTLVRNIARNFRQHVLEQISQYGFTVPQLLLMQEVYNHPGITLKELSERLGLAKSTVSGIVDRLEMQGAVIRSRAKDDRRAVNISLSPKIIELRDSLNIIRNNYLAGLLKDLEADEIEKIIYGLNKLNSLMEAQGKEPRFYQ